MALNRRFQILIEPEQFDRLERAAARSGASVASIIRDAIDRYLPDGGIDTRSAAEFLLAAPAVPVGDWNHEKALLIDERSGLG